MGKLVEITFMSLDGVMDAPDIVEQARPYFSDEEHEAYEKERLLAADALLLGRKTYEVFSQSYPQMADAGGGAPTDFIDRMNSIQKYVVSTTLDEASWNATVLNGDVAEEVRRIKRQHENDIVKYGTGSLDRVLFGQHLVDLFCVVLYPFVLGHGTHLFEGLEVVTHCSLSDLKRFANGTVVLEYVPET